MEGLNQAKNSVKSYQSNLKNKNRVFFEINFQKPAAQNILVKTAQKLNPA